MNFEYLLKINFQSLYFFVFQQGNWQKPCSGPKVWQIAPKKAIAIMKEKVIVLVMSRANFWKVMISPKKRKKPDPKVVIEPLKMLTPISR